MAHFAQIGLNNKVISVTSINNNVITDTAGIEREDLGTDYLANLTGWAVWKRTWKDGSQRKRFAGKGYTYDEDNDAFLLPKPFPSWILNTETFIWEAPIDYPTDGEYYVWNDAGGNWINAEKPLNNWE
tara:strand:+ start:529 stop:912 length:384 start_codon:yes stop_codon:yes gene_type:complete